jgi:predicted DNA-binding transcriptional regulator AlpA
LNGPVSWATAENCNRDLSREVQAMPEDISMSVRDRAAVQQPKRVFKFKEWCELNGFSQDTGFRLLRAGKGPKVTQLSDRRIGIREDHNAEWQDARVRGE